MLTTTSTDGTTIAFDRIGQGPLLILITGALNYTKFGLVKDLIPFLSDNYTVINYDRRGRGASGNNLPYSVDKEIEDIYALIDSSGSPAYLYGHSAGAVLALFAAAELGEHIKAVAAYEPPLSENLKTEIPAKLAIKQSRQMLNKGQNLELVTQFMRFVGMSASLVEDTLSSEHRQALIDMAPTLIYETQIFLHTRHFLRSQARHVSQPTLLLAGDNSLPKVLEVQQLYAKTILNSKTLILANQTHSVDPAVLAPILNLFFK